MTVTNSILFLGNRQTFIYLNVLIYCLVRALATLPLELASTEDEEDLSSPEEPLPLYQQRENYFS